MDATSVHVCKDTTPSVDDSCKENQSPRQSINKKRKRQEDPNHDEIANPFFRPFAVTVSFATANMCCWSNFAMFPRYTTRRKTNPIPSFR